MYNEHPSRPIESVLYGSLRFAFCLRSFAVAADSLRRFVSARLLPRAVSPNLPGMSFWSHNSSNNEGLVKIETTVAIRLVRKSCLK
uniref:Uncharacterized protein n=1 Tax=Hyaloperonospora arabidopsidis (strain Emoy2) TaxID=559515 RepID=M4BI49_HYAAE